MNAYVSPIGTRKCRSPAVDALTAALDVPVYSQIEAGLVANVDDLRRLYSQAFAQPGCAITAEFDGRVCTAIAFAITDAAPTVAWWISDSANVARLQAKHAQSVISLLQIQEQHLILQSEAARLRDENQSLFVEVQSLVNQVASDFEEISLIRSLATNLELSGEPQSHLEIAQPTLAKLAEGLAARSIAIMLVDSQGQPTDQWWTGEPLLNESELRGVVTHYGSAASNLPVVKNDCADSSAGGVGKPDGAGKLNEFILLQCQSRERLHGWVIACDSTEEESVAWAQTGFTTEEASLAETVVGQLAAQFSNLNLLRQKEALFTDVIRALVNAVEARDPYTCGHSERVARFARHLAHLAGHSATRCEQIYLTGLLHDVGKIAIPDGVLQKPSQLDDQERKIIETHTEAGWRILHELDALAEVLPGVLFHHERFDGKGYPDGLSGNNIPLEGRILAVCDAFDAMTSNRPYRDGMPVTKAAEILSGGSGTYWDPELIKLFIDAIEQFDNIRRRYETREIPQRERG